MSVDLRAFARDSASIATVPHSLYSVRQVAVGTFFGGPIGLAYFLGSNYAVLGDRRGRRIAIFSALLLAAVLTGLGVIGVYLSGPVGTALSRLSMPLNFASVLAARHVAQRQLAASRYYDLRSNWHVCGMAALSLLCSLLMIYIVAFLIIFSIAYF
jgi:hypothetical protein